MFRFGGRWQASLFFCLFFLLIETIKIYQTITIAIVACFLMLSTIYDLILFITFWKTYIIPDPGVRRGVILV